MLLKGKVAWLSVAILSFLALAGTGPASASAAQAPTPKARAGLQKPVDVNRADARTLETLPGVGPALAQRIIEGRPYARLQDLDRVKGLGSVKIAALKDLVVFGPASSPATRNGALGSKRPAQQASTPAPPRSGPQAAAALSPGATNAPGVLAKGEKININKASAQDLQRLPGIGPAKAKAIIDYRAKNGDFKTIEGIQQVKGIKTGSFTRIKNVIKVTD